jgi:sugar lactone lactonase YvrE
MPCPWLEAATSHNASNRNGLKVLIPSLLIIVLALTSAAILPWSLRAGDSSATYHQVENWARLPGGTQWGVMSAVGVDAKGSVYAFQRDEPSSKVIVFDSHGKNAKTWGENAFEYPHGLKVTRDGSVWVTDRKMQQAFKYDPDGKLLLTIGKKDVAGDNNSQDTFNGVSDVVVAENGDIFASDGEGANSRVVKFSKDGKFIKSWGTKGSGPGEFNTPHAIAIDSKGRIWVCDRGNKRLEVFDQDGKYLDQMTQFGTPVSLFISKDDVMFVADPAPENRVVIGTTDGKVLEKIEGLDSAHGIAVDSSGAIYVAESAGKSVLKFVKK